MLLDEAASRPDRVVLDDGTGRRTAAALVDRATRAGHWLAAAGGRSAVVAGNRVEYVELVTGALLGGSWVTPVNWHLTAEEVAVILEDSGARVVVVDDEHHAVVTDAVALLPPAAGSVEVVRMGEELDAALAGADDAPFDLDGPAGGSMFYTSGTTGRPKGVRRTVQATVGTQLAGMAVAGTALGLDGRAPHLVTGPLYHAAPVGFAVMDLHNGAPLVLMPRWDAADALRQLTEHGVGHSHLVPTMFVRLLGLPDEVRAAFDPSGLSLVLHGAAPISARVKEAMIEWWGPVLVEYWGASEGGVVTLVGSADWLAHPGTVGRAIPGHEVFAADDDGHRLPAGETGTLWCRNTRIEQVFEYHNDPERTAAAFSGPGTYTIGDIGRVDDDGYVYLSDRASHTIISGGVNIYPAEIEHVLVDHPAVADAAVFGIPDDEWGEQVKAAVEPVEGVAPSTELEAELLAHARSHLAGYKVPRSIDFHEHLPRQPTGKLATRVLRAPYWQGRDRGI